MARVFIIAIILTANASTVRSDVLSDADNLMAANKVREAQRVLREALHDAPGNGRVRHMLARVMSYDGNHDAAVQLLMQGVSDGEKPAVKFNLLLLAGSLSLKRADDGPTVTRKRGQMTVRPQKDTDDPDAFAKIHLEKAESAFRQAIAIKQTQNAIEQLARTLTLAKKPTEAIVFWSKVIKNNPANNKAIAQTASLHFELKQPEIAIKLLKDAHDRRPNNPELIKVLLNHYREIEDAASVAYWEPRIDFAGRVPAFATMTYSKENLERLKSLQKAETVQALLKEKTETSSEMLAIYCWTHPHNQLEDRSFVELGDRKADKLLRSLLDAAQSGCTIRGAINQLARSQPADLFERLLPMLRKDIRTFGFEMDIANAMDVLGDKRAVPALIAVLAPDNTVKPSPDNFNADGLLAARIRAAIALGGFDTKESRLALESGLKNPLIRIACVGAMYRLSNDRELRETLEAEADKDNRDAWIVIDRLARRLPKDKEIERIYKMMFDRLNAKRNSKR